MATNRKGSKNMYAIGTISPASSFKDDTSTYFSANEIERLTDMYADTRQQGGDCMFPVVREHDQEPAGDCLFFFRTKDNDLGSVFRIGEDFPYGKDIIGDIANNRRIGLSMQLETEFDVMQDKMRRHGAGHLGIVESPDRPDKTWIHEVGYDFNGIMHAFNKNWLGQGAVTYMSKYDRNIVDEWWGKKRWVDYDPPVTKRHAFFSSPSLKEAAQAESSFSEIQPTHVIFKASHSRTLPTWISVKMSDSNKATGSTGSEQTQPPAADSSKKISDKTRDEKGRFTGTPPAAGGNSSQQSDNKQNNDGMDVDQQGDKKAENKHATSGKRATDRTEEDEPAAKRSKLGDVDGDAPLLNGAELAKVLGLPEETLKGLIELGDDDVPLAEIVNGYKEAKANRLAKAEEEKQKKIEENKKRAEEEKAAAEMYKATAGEWLKPENQPYLPTGGVDFLKKIFDNPETVGRSQSAEMLNLVSTASDKRGKNSGVQTQTEKIMQDRREEARKRRVAESLANARREQQQQFSEKSRSPPIIPGNDPASASRSTADGNNKQSTPQPSSNNYSRSGTPAINPQALATLKQFGQHIVSFNTTASSGRNSESGEPEPEDVLAQTANMDEVSQLRLAFMAKLGSLHPGGAASTLPFASMVARSSVNDNSILKMDAQQIRKSLNMAPRTTDLRGERRDINGQSRLRMVRDDLNGTPVYVADLGTFQSAR